MASTNQQITANLYQVFTVDGTGNINAIKIKGANIGNVANVKISGGTDGQILTYDGTTGNLKYSTIATTSGNIASLNLNGNGSQVLAGNGVWVAQSTGTGTGNIGNINLNGNTAQYLNGNGAWSNIPVPTGNIANTNYNGNANTYLNGAGLWSVVPGSGSGNIGAVSLNGNALTYLNGSGTWSVVPGSGGGNIGSVSLTGNASQILLGDGTWGTRSTGNIGNTNLNGNTFTYLNGAGLWANVPVGSTGNVGNLNLNGNGSTVLAGNGAWIPTTAGGNVGALNLSGNFNTVLSGTGTWRPIGNIAGSNYTGNTSQFLNGGGSWVAIPTGGGGTPGGSNGQVQFNSGGAFAGDANFTVDTINAQFRSSKVSTDSLLDLKNATEAVIINSAAPTGTYNLDVNTAGIHYTTFPASANLALNIRGSATQTLANLLPLGKSITVTYLMTSGATGFLVNTFSVDGNVVTPRWAGNVKPASSTNSVTSYTLSIIKTAPAPQYTVLASVTGYQ